MFSNVLIQQLPPPPRRLPLQQLLQRQQLPLPPLQLLLQLQQLPLRPQQVQRQLVQQRQQLRQQSIAIQFQ